MQQASKARNFVRVRKLLLHSILCKYYVYRTSYTYGYVLLQYPFFLANTSLALGYCRKYESYTQPVNQTNIVILFCFNRAMDDYSQTIYAKMKSQIRYIELILRHSMHTKDIGHCWFTIVNATYNKLHSVRFKFAKNGTYSHSTTILEPIRVIRPRKDAE